AAGYAQYHNIHARLPPCTSLEPPGRAVNRLPRLNRYFIYYIISVPTRGTKNENLDGKRRVVSLDGELAVVKPSVKAALGQKLPVGALFYDVARIHDQNLVCRLNGGK